jgi:hypothetical protein
MKVITDSVTQSVIGDGEVAGAPSEQWVRPEGRSRRKEKEGAGCRRRQVSRWCREENMMMTWWAACGVTRDPSRENPTQ